MDALLARGDRLCIVPQNVAEFWSVATRSTTGNGLGWRVDETYDQVLALTQSFFLLPDQAAIHGEWLRLVRQYGVTGIDVYDARLVAAMRVHGIRHLLTFDVGDFSRFAEVTVVHPDRVGAFLAMI